MAKCKSCGAEIIWIRTKSGKSMPVNPEKYIVCERSDGTGTFVMPDGRVVKGYPCYGHENAQYGYVSHFATCPYAAKHRRHE